jgi:rubrerythrin
MIGTTLYVTGKNKKEDTYTDLDTDEWNCPECGFLVQAGDKCIYCGTEKSA